jgi:hypothetical protein
MMRASSGLAARTGQGGEVKRRSWRRAGSSAFFVALLAAASVAPAAAQPQQAAADPFQQQIAEATVHPGLLTLYRKGGRLLAEIRPDQLDRVFLLFPAIKEGIGQGYLVSGFLFWDQHWTIAFRRVGRKVQFLRLSTRFRAPGDRQLQTVVAEGYGHSVLAAMEVLAERPNGSVLVDLGAVFFQDLANIAPSVASVLGTYYRMDRGRSSWGSIKAFPRNLELDVRLTFAGALSFDAATVPDSRSVPITVRYSIVDPPAGSGYRPRILDERVGYYYSVVRDLSLESLEKPFVRYLHRWNLQKADPRAARSAPREPIVFYIEKSVPYRFRPAVRRGILAWNEAFEAIGIVDAIEVRFQPDDADWDAEDVRYSTVRWSTDAGFGGFGPIRVDPRTGQIFDADVLINGESFRGYGFFGRLYGIGEQDEAAAELPGAGRCTLGPALGTQVALGLAALETRPSGATFDEFLDTVVQWVVMHEVGHTLGLRHNFKGSAATPLERLHDAEWTRQNGLSGSVMDFLPVNAAPPGTVQGEHFPSSLGAWDRWALEYGYRPFPQAPRPEDELPELSKIAGRSNEPQLAYASDEDLYTWAYEDVDPRTNVFDLSADPLGWAEQRLELVRSLLGAELAERVLRDGEGYQRLRRGFGSVLAELARCLWIASRYVGGYDLVRIRHGQTSERGYLEPLGREKQEAAIGLIAAFGFDDTALLALPPELLANLAPPRWNHWGQPPVGPVDAFPLQQWMALIRGIVLNRLLSASVLARVQNAELAGPGQTLTVAELFSALHTAVWAEVSPPAEPVPEADYIPRFRRDLQRLHLRRLAALALSRRDQSPLDAVLLARAELGELAQQIRAGIQRYETKIDRLSLAHLRQCLAEIDRTLQAAYQLRAP